MISVSFPFGYPIECACPYCGKVLLFTGFTKAVQHYCCHFQSYESDDKIIKFDFDYADRNIFSHRDLQHIIYSLKSQKLKKDIAKRLNSNDPQIVHSAEWELILIHFFSELGDVDYEKALDNGKKPDILYHDKSNNLSFVADIASVSDASIKKTYRASEFLSKISSYLDQITPDNVGFNIRFESCEKGNLEMFPPSRLENNVERFKTWADKNADKLIIGTNHTVRIENNNINISVVNKSWDVGFSHPSRVHSHKQRYSNPVTNALNNKASGQLSHHDDKLVGILLCDSGCMLLNSRLNAWNTVKIETLMNDFFYNNIHIDFVLTFSIYTATSAQQLPQINIMYYINPNSPESKHSKINNLYKLLTKNLHIIKHPTLFPSYSDQLLSRKDKNNCYWIYRTDPNT